MCQPGLQTPVVLIIFNRTENAQLVLNAIAQVRPARLLVIADGPRATRPGEDQRCDETRKILSTVDWPCEISTNFATANMGCDPRIISGLDWVFSLVEEAIIIEDDCVPEVSFFSFCAQMLERYRGDDRVAAISGTNFTQDLAGNKDSYFFRNLGAMWGWATWARQWARHDRLMLDWPAQKASGYLYELLGKEGKRYWEAVFDDCYRNPTRAAWDYRWIYTCLFSHRLTVTPRCNLVRNVGWGQQATHTVNKDKRLMLKAYELPFPLQHPTAMVWDRRADLLYQSRLKNTLARKLIRRSRLLGARVLGPRLFGYPV